jgi:hypothetical protein
MPRVEIVAADTPLGERVQAGFGYPLHGAALPTRVALALIHYAGLLPGYIGGRAMAWPDHPLRAEIDAQRQQLASPA